MTSYFACILKTYDALSKYRNVNDSLTLTVTFALKIAPDFVAAKKSIRHILLELQFIVYELIEVSSTPGGFLQT